MSLWTTFAAFATIVCMPFSIRVERVTKVKTISPQLKIEIVSATNLKNADFMGKSDPYVVCKMVKQDGTDVEVFKTTTKDNDLNPEWNEEKIFDYAEGSDIGCQVWDSDYLTSDDPLGKVSISSADFASAQGFEENMALEGGDNGKLLLRIKHLPCDASAAPAGGGAGDCTETLEAGDTCQPTCNDGYTVSGKSSCDKFGAFSAASCQAKPCNHIAPKNGKAGDCTESLASGDECQPMCDDGYTASGTTTCELGELKAATCDPKPCDASSAPTHGKEGDCTGSLASGDECQPTCDEGYTASGTTTCHLGELKAATCEAPAAPAAPTEIIPSGTEVATDTAQSSTEIATDTAPSSKETVATDTATEATTTEPSGTLHQRLCITVYLTIVLATLA